MKIRIVTNGSEYKIQEYRWLNGWEWEDIDHHCNMPVDEILPKRESCFETFEAAIKFAYREFGESGIRSIIAHSEGSRAAQPKWFPITKSFPNGIVAPVIHP